MWIIGFLKKSLEGRGFYPIFFIILTWTYTIIIIIVLICQLLLYIFRIKYKPSTGNNDTDIRKDENE